MKIKVSARERRKYRIRKKISGTETKPRVTVFKSDKHTYAQLICDVTGTTLASASTQDKDIKTKLDKSTKSVESAQLIGKILAERASKKGISTAVFDRNGYKFHGRVKAVADGARTSGLNF